MFPQLKWLFFDIGSTLADESRANEHRILDAIRGTDISYAEAYAKAVRLAERGDGNPLKHLGLPLTPWHSEDEAVYPEAVECLAGLHGKYKIGIIANQVPGTADRMTKYGLAPYLDLIVSSAEVGLEKPDVRIFQTALARADCPPENAAMIGDRLDNDIRPAKGLGMTTIWIRQGFGGMAHPSAAEETPDHCVGDLRQLLALLR